MSALNQVMRVVNLHQISDHLLESDSGISGGLITNSHYAWFASGSKMILYSKLLGSVVSSKSFAVNQKNKSIKITFVKELITNGDICNFLLVGCSSKLSGLLFICQMTTLTTIRCIELPHPISYIATILNEPYFKDRLCNEFKIMSTVLLVGMDSGAVYAIDLRQNHIEMQLKINAIIVNESRPNKLFILRKNENCQDIKDMSNDSDCHLAMFINENFYAYCKKQYNGKLHLKVSNLLYIKEINTIAIGYSTGHFQLWDCNIMRTIYLLKEPKCVMPITNISFLEPSDDPNNLCYLWVIQSDNSKLPNATMIALTYNERTMMPNGCQSYRVYKGDGVKLEMSLNKETGFGRCVSALSLSNVNMFRMENDMDEDCEIRLFSMLLEICQNEDASPESYLFLFDINQWYKAQMPSTISHLKVSNSFASFVKLPHNLSYLDFNITDKTLRPFSYNFRRNNVEEFYYPSSIYFECDCLVDKEIIRFKHAGVQQQILDNLQSKSWRLLKNPSLVFSQCLQTNLKPFFWDKPDDYDNYSLPDQRSFVISILIEHKMMSVISECAEQWKNGIYVSSEATILHLVQSLWKHVMVVKQYADKLCVPLFDYSGTELDKKNERILNHCLSQMQCVKHFLKDLHNRYGVHIINVDYSYRVYTLNLVTEYFKAVTCFLNYGLLPESIEKYPIHSNIQCDFTSLIEYANKRRMQFGDSQLYLVDAIVNNEPKGNKLIEQWLHEGGEITRGMYPPSNIQCLLRIYLNAALSDLVKNYITVYFLIDICSTHNVNTQIANRMCNFVAEFDIENKGLNALCRASWLLDHDMFEDAMIVLSNNNDWKTMNDDISWFHWTVLKLLIFKAEYSWAQFYFKLINIDLVKIDDHKFYLNIQVLNNCCFEALNYVRELSITEKPILFEYLFGRCKELKKLKRLIQCTLDLEEERLFFSYLKKINDPESLTFQLLFLLQRGRYLEASELHNSLSDFINKSNDDALTIASILVKRFYKNIPDSMKQNHDRPPLKNVYKKTEVIIKHMNSDRNIFNLPHKANNSILRRNNSTNNINLILPISKSTLKRSSTHTLQDLHIHTEKHRKIDVNVVVNIEKTTTEIVSPIGKKVLDILNTPLVEKTKASPYLQNISSILKTGSAKNHSHILSIKDDNTPLSKNIIRFSIPGNDDNKIDRVSFVEDNQECGNTIASTGNNNLANKIINQPIKLNIKELLVEDFESKLNSVIKTEKKENIEYEKMDISDDSEPEDLKTDEICHKEIKNKMDSNMSTENNFVLNMKEKNETPQKKLKYENRSSTTNNDYVEISVSNNKVIDTRLYSPMDTNNSYSIQEFQSSSKNKKIIFSDQVNEDCNDVILDSESETKEKSDDSIMILDSESETKEKSDDSLIVLDSEIETKNENAIDSYEFKEDDDDENNSFSSSSSTRSLDSSSVSYIASPASSNESDLDNTRYGRFKSSKKLNQSLESQSNSIKKPDVSINLDTESEGSDQENAHPNDDDNNVVNLDSDDDVNLDSDDEGDILLVTKNEVEILPVTENEVELLLETEDEVEILPETDNEVENVSETEDEVENVSETEDEVENVSETEDEVENVSETEDEVETIEQNNRIEEDDDKEIFMQENLTDNRSDDEYQDEDEDDDENQDEDDDENQDEDESIKSSDSSSISVVSSCDSDVDDGRLNSSKSNYSENNVLVVEENILELHNNTSYNENDEICNVQNENFENDHASKDKTSENQAIIKPTLKEPSSTKMLIKNFKIQDDTESAIIAENYMLSQTDNTCMNNENMLDICQDHSLMSPVKNNLEKIIDNLNPPSDTLSEKQSQDYDYENECCQKNLSSGNNSSIEMSSPIPDDGFNDLITKAESSQLKVDGNHSLMSPVKNNLEKIIDNLNPPSDTLTEKQSQDYDYENEYCQKNLSSGNNSSIEMSSPIPDDGFNDLITRAESSQLKVDGNHSLMSPVKNNLEKIIDNLNPPSDTLTKKQSHDYDYENEYCQKNLSSGNNSSIEMSSPIPDDGFNDLITKAESSQLKVDGNQSTQFLFGESFFGQKEIPDNKPMLLFGQVYSLVNEQIIEDSNDNKHETQDLVMGNSVDIFNNKGTEEVSDDIQDILELESLPDSNPDDNIDACKSSRSNSLHTNDEEVSDYNGRSSVLLDNSPLSKTVISENVDKQIPETEKQITKIKPEKESFNVDNTIETKSKELISQNVEHVETYSTPRRSSRAKSVQKKFSNSIMTRSRRAKSNSSLSSIEHLNQCNDNQLLYDNKKDNTLELLSQQNLVNTPVSLSGNISSSSHLNKVESNSEAAITDLKNEEINYIQHNKSKDINQVDTNILDSANNDEVCEPQKLYTSKSKELNKTKVEESLSNKKKKKNTNIQSKGVSECLMSVELVPLKQPVPSNNESPPNNESPLNNIDPYIILARLPTNKQEVEQSIVGKSDKLEKTQNIQDVGRRMSSRKKNPNPKFDLEEKNSKLNTSKLSINKQITNNESESLLHPTTKVMTTNASKRCKTNLIQSEIMCTSNIFRPSGIDEDNMRVLSRKKSKSQENLTVTKRKSGRRSKSVASEEEPISTKNVAFGLDIIPEETSNSDKNVENEPYLQQHTIVKTPRRAKSVQPDPVLTLSVVKTKPKRSSSVNSRILIIPEETSNSDKNVENEPSIITRKSKFNFHLNKTKEIKHDIKTLNLQQHTIVKTPRRAKSVQPDPVLTLSVVKTKPKRSSSVNSRILIIPEETSNSDKNVENEPSIITRKSKFNFHLNKTKEIKHDIKTLNLQQHTIVKTPRRAKSVQPDPVLTLSVVKTKPKRSSSVNSRILNDKSPTEKDDFMKVLEKVFTSPTKEKKRCSSELEKNRKRPKTSKHTAESESNVSNQNLINNMPYTDTEFSPIPGDNLKHMLFTPATKRKKIQMSPLNFEIDESNTVMTRSMIQNNSLMKVENIDTSLPKKTEGLVPKQKNKNIKETINQCIPIESAYNVPSTSTRRVTRYQQSILERSLQSTSIIEEEEEGANDISVQKSEKKKISKKTIQKKM